MKKIFHLILVMLFAAKSFSQDTLPKFTLTERGGKATVSWTNPYQNLIQLNVQSSFDSLKSFSTIFSAPSPQLPQNGYTDVRPVTNRYFYRIFYVLEGGSYFFTRSKRANGYNPSSNTANAVNDAPVSRDLTNGAFTNFISGDKRVVTIKMRDSVLRQLSVNAYRSFKDSILRLTKDTLYATSDLSIGLSTYRIPAAYKISQFVFVNKEGYVSVSVPLVNEKKYNIKFFEEDGTALFEIRTVKETPLTLDKAIFVHSGWFLFELYEDNRLKEKNRLFVPKEF